MQYEIRSYSIGESLGKAFSIYLDNFVPLVMIFLAANVPGIIQIFLLSMQADITIAVIGNVPITLFSSLLTFASLAISYACMGVAILLISQRYLGKKVNFGELFSNMSSLIFPLLGLSIISTLYIALGFILLIVPGIIWAMGICLSSYVLVIEKKSIFQSMERSKELMKGYKWKIFGWFLVYGIIISLVTYGISQIVGTTVGSTLQAAGTLVPMAQILLTLFSAIFSGPFLSCFMVLIYFNIRIDKEGFALEHLAEQFETADQEPEL